MLSVAEPLGSSSECGKLGRRPDGKNQLLALKVTGYGGSCL